MPVGIVEKKILDALTQVMQVRYAKFGGLYSDGECADKIMTKFEDSSQQNLANSEELLQDITSFISTRWKKICNTDDDYTNNQGGVNGVLIKLAFDLYEDGVIESPYIFLMPTLVTDFNPVSQAFYHEGDLKDFVLNDSGTALIDINSIIDGTKASGVCTFYMVDKEVYKLTDREKERVHKKMSKKSLQLAASPLNFQHLSERSVLAIKWLVEEIVTAKGLAEELNEDSKEFKHILWVYKIFNNFIQLLSDEEKNALLKHPVYTRTIAVPVTFEEHLEGIFGTGNDKYKEERDDCITTQMEPLAKIVKQYLPDTIFTNRNVKPWVVEIPNRDNPKLCCVTRRVFDEQALKNRCRYLMVELFTHKFSVLGGVDISYDNLGKIKVPQSASEIFNEIKRALEGNATYSQVYQKIRYQLVEDAINRVSPTRADDTKLWLQSLVDESLWLNTTADIDYRDLAIGMLAFLSNEHSLAERAHAYIDKIFIILSSSSEIKDIELQIVFQKLLMRLNAAEKNDVYDSIHEVSRHPLGNEFPKHYRDALIHRVMYFLSVTKPPFSFLDKKKIHLVNEDLFKQLRDRYWRSRITVDDDANARDVVDVYVDSLPKSIKSKIAYEAYQQLKHFKECLGESSLGSLVMESSPVKSLCISS